MSHADFKIGKEFTCGGSRFRCTDVGTRIIAAICVYDPYDPDRDPSWFKGPPYAVEEVVFDENDFPACDIVPSE